MISCKFYHNQASSYSNAIDAKCKSIKLVFCDFRNNTSMDINGRNSIGGVLYAKIYSFTILNTTFINNSNSAGGVAYFELNEQYSILFGFVENIYAFGNKAIKEDAGVFFFSLGILEINIVILNSYFEKNYANIRIFHILELYKIYFYRRWYFSHSKFLQWI